MSIIQINESEKNRISDLHKKYQTEVNEKRITLKEGIQTPNEEPLNEFGGVGTFVTKFIGGLFTGLKTVFRSTDDKVLKFVSTEMSNAIGRLAKSNSKQISMEAIEATLGYKKSLSTMVENLAQTKYKLPYERLLQKEKDLVIKEASKGLNVEIVTQLKTAGKTLAGNVDNLKGAQLVKMGQKTSQITKTIANLNKVKLDKASTLLKSNAKLVGSGKSGAALLNKVKSGKVNIIKGGQLYSASTKSLGSSNIKVYRISNDTLKKLALLGITGAAVLFLIGKMDNSPDPKVLLDDDGKDASEGGNTIGDDGKTKEDSTSTGNGKTGKYTNCEGNDFPLAFGCMSTKIAEIQKCLGVADDGRLGPITRKALEDNKYDTSKGLSQDVYTVILRNCGKKSETDKKEDGLKMTDLATTPSTTVTGETPTNIQMKAADDGSKTTKTGKQVFDELVASGLLKKQSLTGRIVVKDKNNAEEPIDVPASEINALSEYLKEFGYTKGTKNKDKRYGDKFVWIKDRKNLEL